MHKTKHKATLEHISQILIQCLKFESILTANIEPGLLVDK